LNSRSKLENNMDGVASVPQTSALIKRKARCDATDDDGLLDPLARLELSLRFETPEHESVVDSDEDEWQCKRRRISRQASVHVLQACSSLFEGVARIQDSFAEFSGRPCNSPVPWDSAPSPVSGERIEFADSIGSIRFSIGCVQDLCKKISRPRRVKRRPCHVRRLSVSAQH